MHKGFRQVEDLGFRAFRAELLSIANGMMNGSRRHVLKFGSERKTKPEDFMAFNRATAKNHRAQGYVQGQVVGACCGVYGFLKGLGGEGFGD